MKSSISAATEKVIDTFIEKITFCLKICEESDNSEKRIEVRNVKKNSSLTTFFG